MARFHGKPRTQPRFSANKYSGEIILDDFSLCLPQPFATRSIEWLKSHPEDVCELEAFLKVAKQADGLMFDVGAHVGAFATLFCKVSAYDAVAFEPVPELQTIIKRTAELNHLQDERIQLVGKAIGDEVGLLEMQIDQATGFAQIQLDQGSEFRPPSTIIAATTSVDVARSELQTRVALLKIDVEGFEQEVLRGSHCVLSQDRPIVSIEIHNSCLARRDIDLKRMLDEVVSHDYSLLRLNGRRISASAAARTFLWRSHLLAVPREKCSFYERFLRD